MAFKLRHALLILGVGGVSVFSLVVDDLNAWLHRLPSDDVAHRTSEPPVLRPRDSQKPDASDKPTKEETVAARGLNADSESTQQHNQDEIADHPPAQTVDRAAAEVARDPSEANIHPGLNADGATGSVVDVAADPGLTANRLLDDGITIDAGAQQAAALIADQTDARLTIGSVLASEMAGAIEATLHQARAKSAELAVWYQVARSAAGQRSHDFLRDPRGASVSAAKRSLRSDRARSTLHDHLVPARSTGDVTHLFKRGTEESSARSLTANVDQQGETNTGAIHSDNDIRDKDISNKDIDDRARDVSGEMVKNVRQDENDDALGRSQDSSLAAQDHSNTADAHSAANASLDPVEDTPAETIFNPKRRAPSIKRVDLKPRADRKTRSEAGKRELVAISRART